MSRPEVSTAVAAAQANWAARMGAGGAQDRAPGEVVAADLPAPAGLTAVRGRGQTTLSWDPVPGAIGYAVHHAGTAGGEFRVLDHGGGDVLAVPHGPYADTTGGGPWYAVAALRTVTAMGPLSTPVRAAGEAGAGATGAGATGAGATGAGAVDVAVAATGGRPIHRPWQAMIGSEHLSHLLCTDQTGGEPIGAGLRAALRRVHDDLGVRTVRAHHILGDDLGVYRGAAGAAATYDFTGVDRVYDIVTGLGLHPVVELGFMPRDLARDPDRTVFAYLAGISPPADWQRWADLIRALVAHLLDRYGPDEVRAHWYFEVWNEPNLSVFFAGTPDEYWRLYDVTAAAVKDVDPALRVGGPASAAVGWIDEQTRAGAPVDFLSTHVYGSPPLDLRPLAGGRPLLWTEWGVTATHGNPINDTVFAAVFLLRGMRSAAGRIDALAPWVASDHFEELGRPPRLLHGGFGLLTVGNLAKPKFWALALAQRLGDTELPVTLSGDGADSLVEAWAARTGDGTIGVLLWNGTLDHNKVAGDPALARTVTVRAAATGTVRTWRVDHDHHDISRWSGGDWPDDDQWRALTAADHLDETEPARPFDQAVTLDLPNPGIAYLEITPGRRAGQRGLRRR